MAKIVISNAIANIAELKSRLRGVKTPGKRILAAAFKNNDYSALIGELLTRIELYQSVGVLDYKLKDVDTIQGMKFKFGFESVLASTLKASGVSSSPRVVQQIVRQQQVMAPVDETMTSTNYRFTLKQLSMAFDSATSNGDLSSDDEYFSATIETKLIILGAFSALVDELDRINGLNYRSKDMVNAAKYTCIDVFVEEFGINEERAAQMVDALLLNISKNPITVGLQKQMVYKPKQQVIAQLQNEGTTGYTTAQVSRAVSIATDTGDLDQYLGDAFDNSIFSGKINVANALTAYMNELNRINGLNVRTKQMVTEAKKLSASSISATLAISAKEAIQFIDGVMLHIGKNPIDDTSVGYQDFSLKKQRQEMLSSKAEYYQELIETATEVGALDGADADMWHIQPIKVKNSIASLISDALGKLEATGDFETVADDFGYERDIDFYLGFDPGVAILGCIVDATSGVNTGQ